MWTGRLRIAAVNDDCWIKLEDANTSQLFAVSRYDLEGTAVEAVTDSSRYFVLRLEDQQTGASLIQDQMDFS